MRPPACVAGVRDLKVRSDLGHGAVFFETAHKQSFARAAGRLVSRERQPACLVPWGTKMGIGMLFARITIFAALTLAMRWLGVYSADVFWRLLLVGETSFILEHTARSTRPVSVDRLSKAHWFATVFQFVGVLGTAVCILCIGASVTVLTCNLVGLQVPFTLSWLGTAEPAVHLVALLAPILACIGLWRSRIAKVKVLDECSEVFAQTNNAVAAIDQAETVEEAREAGHTAVELVLCVMLRQRRFQANGQRTGLVFSPDGRGHFDPIIMWPVDAPYRAVRPAVYRPAEVAQLMNELSAARKALTGDALRAREAEIKRRLEECASITGYAARVEKLHVFPDVTQEFWRSEAYLQSIPAADRAKWTIRSKAAIRLQCGEKMRGVLVLVDTAVGGFTNKDKSVIEVLAPYVAMIVDKVMRRIEELERQEGKYA